MKIFIITMEDPLYTVSFIKSIIAAREKDIVGVAISKGGRLKIGRKRSKMVYLMSLLLIMGPWAYLINVVRVIRFKIRRILSRSIGINDHGLAGFCKKRDIPCFHIGSPNNPEFLSKLREIGPDVIINQSQYILKKQLLDIPRLGTLNRHNALLPKNRGRLTPFWVLYKGETETGVSIHFVNEGMDAGDILVQERFPVEPRDTFNTIVRKNYAIAANAMLKALTKLESGNYVTLPNNDQEASHNPVPGFRDALKFRFRRLLR